MSVIQIAVAGNVASGKSTLSRAIANYFNWIIIPENAFGLTYLDELFKNPTEWAFEAQIAFFVEKVIEIHQAVDKEINHIVDRCLYEDIDIYAKYFCLNGSISPREQKILNWIKELGAYNTMSPTFLIYNKCNWEICAERSLHRNQYQDKIMNKKFIRDIGELTQLWVENLCVKKTIPIFTIDSSNIDFRDKLIEKIILDDIKAILENITKLESNILNTEILRIMQVK